MRDAIISNVVFLIKSPVHNAEPAAGRMIVSLVANLSGLFNHQSRSRTDSEPVKVGSSKNKYPCMLLSDIDTPGRWAELHWSFTKIKCELYVLF